MAQIVDNVLNFFVIMLRNFEVAKVKIQGLMAAFIGVITTATVDTRSGGRCIPAVFIRDTRIMGPQLNILDALTIMSSTDTLLRACVVCLPNLAMFILTDFIYVYNFA